MVFFITLLVFLLVSLMLSIGLVFSGKKIRSSCGGEGVLGPNGEKLSCETCPNRNKKSRCENQKTL